VRPRRLWWVAFWLIVTGGLYFFVWYYLVNRELRDGARIMTGPFLSLLAVTLGWALVFPPFLSWWRTFARIRDAQLAAGVANPVRPEPAFLLELLVPLFLPLGVLHAQAELNRVWRRT
jgi:hypothetical protein